MYDHALLHERNRLCTIWTLISGTGQQMLVLTLKLSDHTTGIQQYTIILLLLYFVLVQYLILRVHTAHYINAIKSLPVYAVKARSLYCRYAYDMVRKRPFVMHCGTAVNGY
jgi:hypothetical protein